MYFHVGFPCLGFWFWSKLSPTEPSTLPQNLRIKATDNYLQQCLRNKQHPWIHGVSASHHILLRERELASDPSDLIVAIQQTHWPSK